MTNHKAYLVHRIETRSEAALGPLLRHLVEHGEPGGSIELRPSATPAQMERWRRDARDMRGPGNPPEPRLVGAKIIDWPPEKGREWGEACVAEFERLMPCAKIVEARLHTRETEWHVHIVCQPRGIDKNGKLRASRNAMLRSAVEIETGEPPPEGGKRSRKERRDDCAQKPLALLRRIINASNNPGDVVLDPFCGCATACIAAEQRGRMPGNSRTMVAPR